MTGVCISIIRSSWIQLRTIFSIVVLCCIFISCPYCSDGGWVMVVGWWKSTESHTLKHGYRFQTGVRMDVLITSMRIYLMCQNTNDIRRWRCDCCISRRRCGKDADFQYLAPSLLAFMTTMRKIHVSPTVRAPWTTGFLCRHDGYWDINRIDREETTFRHAWGIWSRMWVGALQDLTSTSVFQPLGQTEVCLRRLTRQRTIRQDRRTCHRFYCCCSGVINKSMKWWN